MANTNTTTEYYNAKAGRIAIFNGENSADFERTCEAALVIVGAWSFVDGQEDAAAARSADAVKRRGEGIKLIFNSVGQSFQVGIREYMKQQDPRGMWLEVAKYNRAKDSVYVGEVIKQSRTTIFDPEKSTIREYVNDLEWFRTILAASDRPLSEQDLLEQLLSGLPDDPKWTNAKNWCLRDQLDFKSTITLLQSNEPFTRPVPSMNARSEGAALAQPHGNGFRGRGRGRSRGRGYRDRGRLGRGSGRNFQGRPFLRRPHPEGRGGQRGSEAEPRLANKNECRFCYREDHFVNNCPALRRAQKEQENKKDWKGNALKADDTAEASNVALVEETDDDSYYLRSVPATAM
jgi:hypothetical protein